MICDLRLAICDWKPTRPGGNGTVALLTGAKARVQSQEL